MTAPGLTLCKHFPAVDRAAASFGIFSKKSVQKAQDFAKTLDKRRFSCYTEV